MRAFFVFLGVLASLGWAQPRVGTEPGLTRLVFDLPAGATYRLSQNGQVLSIRFQGTPPRRLDTPLNTPEVVAPARAAPPIPSACGPRPPIAPSS